MNLYDVKIHIFRVVNIVRNVACYKALREVVEDFDQNFWIIIYGNFFDMAILEWCKVFGTNDEPTHWKLLMDENDQDAFRRGIFNCCGINEKEWKDHWEYIRKYRNYMIAHYIEKPNEIPCYPNLDIILKSSFYYYDWLISNWREKGQRNYPDDIQEYYKRFIAQSKNFVKNSYESTKGLEDFESIL